MVGALYSVSLAGIDSQGGPERNDRYNGFSLDGNKESGEIKNDVEFINWIKFESRENGWNLKNAGVEVYFSGGEGFKAGNQDCFSGDDVIACRLIGPARGLFIRQRKHLFVDLSASQTAMCYTGSYGSFCRFSDGKFVSIEAEENLRSELLKIKNAPAKSGTESTTSTSESGINGIKSISNPPNQYRPGVTFSLLDGSLPVCKSGARVRICMTSGPSKIVFHDTDKQAWSYELDKEMYAICYQGHIGGFCDTGLK